MSLLIIFDDEFDIKSFNTIKKEHRTIHLFPLTSNFLIVNKIQEQFKQLSQVKIEVINSGRLINDAVTVMQKTIHTWSYQLGETLVGKKTLKEWFLLPDHSGSSWWFGLLSEKNSVQDDVFFKIAQVNAIKKQIEENYYVKSFVCLADKNQRKIVSKILSSLIHNNCLLPVIPSKHPSNIKVKLFNLLKQLNFTGAFFTSIIHWFVWLRDSRYARRHLPPLKQRMKESDPFLFITYFPNVDEEMAKKGAFRNKYSIALQEKLASLKIPFTWLLMPVFYNGYNFQSSIQLAKKLSLHGEKLFVLQEFFTKKVFLKSIGWWLRQCLLSLVLMRFVDKKKLVGNLTDIACLPHIHYLWQNSFIGMSGTRGIIFYLTFLELFKTLPSIHRALYFCEMQAWEKAFVLAKKQQSPRTKLYAFQHTVVMRNYFNYFYDIAETKQYYSHMDMPFPDTLIANGELMYSLLAESQYPAITQAEAIRQLYLCYVDQTLTKKPILLVAGSADRIETKALITLVYSAYPVANEFEIWFKGSPVNPIEPLFIELGITIDKTHYKILYQDIMELLKIASVALVPNTTVSIEAIAMGCALIIPIFSDTMLMNPIVDTKADYWIASHPNELKMQVTTLLYKTNRVDEKKAKEVIENYWHVDPALPLWTKILTEVES